MVTIALRLLMTGIVALAACGCSIGGGCGSGADAASCTRVLFVGNSYTYVNDLPGTFAQLARAGGHRVETGMVAEGGETLADHAGSATTGAAIQSEKWSDVVLQEQSQIPSVAGARAAQMFPAARQLARSIEATGAMPVLYETWAHRNGWPENGMLDYATMQSQIDAGYGDLGHDLDVPIAPVGHAWWTVVTAEPQLALWQDDGSHPTMAGTYLAACVFYAVVFRQSPEGLGFTAGLPDGTARLLQGAAAGTVLTDPARWHLP